MHTEHQRYSFAEKYIVKINVCFNREKTHSMADFLHNIVIIIIIILLYVYQYYTIFKLFRHMTSLNFNSGLYGINLIRTILHAKNSGLFLIIHT